MKIVKKSVVIEIPETLEDGSAKIMCDKPYRIERIEKDGAIVWYGYNTNWKFENNQWYKLYDSEFIIMDREPEYERIYQNLISK